MKQVFILLICMFIMLSNLCCLNEPQIRQPYIILIEYNPWIMIIGSDSPTFALYNDGLTIFYDQNKGYQSVVLSKEELRNFKVDPNLFKLKDYYELFNGTDLPTTSIYVWNNGKRKSIEVCGLSPSNKNKLPAEIEYTQSKVPREFLNLYHKLVIFKHNKSKKWLPEKIEVLVWPSEDSLEKPYLWPKNWPNLKTPGTRKRHDNLYSIYLDSCNYSHLISISKELKENQAILMNGHKWSISYRFPFPKEELWMTK